MSDKTKKVVGIYIDKTQACVFGTSNRSSKGNFELIADIDNDDHKDEMYKNEKVELAKEKQDLRGIYGKIEQIAINDDLIYIFGPGKAQEQLRNHLEDKHHFKIKEIVLGSTDQLTTAQMIHHLDKHFE